MNWNTRNTRKVPDSSPYWKSELLRAYETPFLQTYRGHDSRTDASSARLSSRGQKFSYGNPGRHKRMDARASWCGILVDLEFWTLGDSSSSWHGDIWTNLCHRIARVSPSQIAKSTFYADLLAAGAASSNLMHSHRMPEIHASSKSWCRRHFEEYPLGEM